MKKTIQSALHASVRWTMLIACFALIGPLASLPLSLVRDADGGHAMSMLVNDGLLPGLFAGVLVFAAALAAGVVGAYFFSTGWACVYAGVVLAWGAYRCGTLEDMVRQSRSDGPLGLLAVEGVVAVLLAAIVAGMIQRVSVKRQGLRITPGALLIQGDVRSAATQAQIVAVCAGIGAGGVAFLSAVTDIKGQAIFAAFLGSLVAGLVAQTLARSKGGQATVVLVVAATVLPAVLAPLVAKFTQGSDIVAIAFAGRLFNPARVMGLDWAAGAMLGAPLGLGWAGAMLDQREGESAAA